MNLEIIFKCEKAAHICDKSQYAESSWRERMMMKMHQRMCSVCRNHSKMNSRLTNLIRRAKIQTLPDDARSEMKRMIQREISK